MKIGLDAKLYYGAAGSSASTELTIVKEVTLNIEGDDVTGGDRSAIWKDHAIGQLDATLEITMTQKPTDAGYQAMRDSLLDRTPLALKALDEASGEGLDADFQVLSMSRGEPLDGEIVVTFSCGTNRDQRDPAWV